MTATTAAAVEESLRAELDRGVRAGIFPGAAACVGFFGSSSWVYVEVATGSLGPDLGAVAVDSIYDLASLTKPWVATTALRLHQRGEFAVDAPVSHAIEEAREFPIGERSWEEVLSHRSGLEAWEPFYESVRSAPGVDPGAVRARVLAALLPRFVPDQVGVPVYSDLGYILSGFALERVTGVSLERLVAREVSEPLGIDESVFYAATREDSSWRSRCASTGWSTHRDKELRGEVHDDNCALLGGVAGHAGLFGEARSVARFGAAQISALHGRLGALDEELVQHATARRPGGSNRLGWDGKTDRGSAAGSRIDVDAFGHLGFTGTSIWCDSRRQLVTVLLTNRVAVSDDNVAIRAFRPEFQDAVLTAFDEGSAVSH